MQRYYHQTGGAPVQHHHAAKFARLFIRRNTATHPERAIQIVGTLLDIRDEQLFEHTPEAIFELFLLMEQMAN
jgi:UTP:GlnB (protein PII) uridylyltransferase